MSEDEELVDTNDIAIEEWTMYTDEKSGYPYYYNNITGESQWEIPDTNLPKHRKSRKWNSRTAMYDTIDDEENNITEDEPLNDYYSDEASDEDFPIQDEKELKQSVNWYVRSSLFHVAVIETPLAMIEGFCKGFFFLLLSITCYILAPVRGPKTLKLGKELLRNSMMLIAAGTTLLIPGSALFAYRDLISAWKDGRLVRGVKVDNWYLGGIPTFMGNVDARIFYVFTSGQGSYAVNVCEQKGSRVAAD